MHKLKKPRPSEMSAVHASNTVGGMSRTMQLAVSEVKVSAASRGDGSSVSANLQRRGTWFSAPLAAAPHTTVERYWAARALVAETLLSARDQHQAELAEVRRMEGWKGEREIAAVLYASDQRQKRSEQTTVVCLVVLLGFMSWLVVMIAPDRDAKGRSSKPSHFTIPILSPFASVVEHETGVFGTKAVVIFIVVVGIATYAALRHRIAQWHAR